MNRIAKYLVDVMNEWRRTSKPFRAEITGLTKIVLIVIVVMILYLWGLDFILDKGRELLFR